MEFFIDQTIAYRLELSSAWRARQAALTQTKLRPETQSVIKPIAGGYAICVRAGTGAGVNRAIGVGFQGPVSAHDLDSIEAFYRAHQLPASVHLCPLAHSSFVELLWQRGYRVEKFFNVLARPLSETMKTTPLASQVRVAPILSGQKDLWIETVARGFSGNDTVSSEMAAMMAETLHSESARCFLAWVNGEPASGGAMLISEGVALLCAASTRPPFRRIGIQTALLQARLIAAQEAGCDLAHVLVSPDNGASHRNIERAGFRLAYTKAVVTQKESISSKNS